MFIQSQFNLGNFSGLKLGGLGMLIFMTALTLAVSSTDSNFTAQETISGNSITAGQWAPTCLTPDNLGDEAVVSLGQPIDSTEPTLQEFFNNQGINLDVEADQKNYQVWQADNPVEVAMEIKLLEKFARNYIAFGYYLNDDPDTFIGLFQVGDHPDHPDLPNVSAGYATTTTIAVPNNVGFAIDVEDHRNGNIDQWFTGNSLNTDSDRQAVVYDSSHQQHILAFEDRRRAISDEDFNDLIVEIKVLDCWPIIEEPINDNKPEINAGDVVINEIMWMGSSAHFNDQWIELRNITSQDIDLAQWTIDNARASGQPPYMIPAGTDSVIEAGGLFLITRTNVNSPNSALNVTPQVNNASISLANDYNNNGPLILRDSNGQIIDQTPTPTSSAWPAGISEPGDKRWSMQRTMIPGDGTAVSDWYTCDREVLDGDNSLGLMESYWKEDHRTINCGTPGHENLSSNDPTKIANETTDENSESDQDEGKTDKESTDSKKPSDQSSAKDEKTNNDSKTQFGSGGNNDKLEKNNSSDSKIENDDSGQPEDEIDSKTDDKSGPKDKSTDDEEAKDEDQELESKEGEEDPSDENSSTDESLDKTDSTKTQKDSPESNKDSIDSDSNGQEVESSDDSDFKPEEVTINDDSNQTDDQDASADEEQTIDNSDDSQTEANDDDNDDQEADNQSEDHGSQD